MQAAFRSEKHKAARDEVDAKKRGKKRGKKGGKKGAVMKRLMSKRLGTGRRVARANKLARKLSMAASDADADEGTNPGDVPDSLDKAASSGDHVDIDNGHVETKKPGRPKGKALAKAKAKSKAKAKAKATPKGKAKAKAKVTAKASAKGKAKAAAKKKGRPFKLPPADGNDGEDMAHEKQRYVWIGNRWLYEILPGQVYGCSSRRFIFFGCGHCKKDSFRGKSAADMLEDEEYQYGLTWLNENGVEIAEPEHDEFPEEKPRKRSSK